MNMVVLVSTIKEHTILYVENIMKKTKKTAKKTEKKKTILNYFEDVALRQSTSDTKGRGQVKGRDIDRINDFLNNQDK
jgi:hypothetical protein